MRRVKVTVSYSDNKACLDLSTVTELGNNRFIKITENKYLKVIGDKYMNKSNKLKIPE